jgi:hypothetical protein
LVEEVLTLADELRLVMIERLLAKSDLEVGLDTLLLDPSMRSTQPDPDVRDHRP